ncbi:MAG: ABC transporter substrate-binding protein [Acidobacteriota bacterium]|nr:ABC transporter substrate-binding protein [Acidobacteriota bacterium]
MPKKSFQTVAALMLIFTFVVFANPPKYGGTVIVAVTGDPSGLNPAITTQGGVTTIGGSIFNGLVALDFNLNPVPELATKWEISDDGRTYTFQLAENAEFHDGKPLTSDDVKFTFEELLLKYHSRTRAAIGGNLKNILTPEAHTVVFEFEKPYAAFLQLIDVTNAPVMPKHLFENTDPLTNPYNTKPVGSGPFKFGEWQQGNYLLLEKNENYFKEGKPYLDKVIYKVLPNNSTAAIALENGEVDLLANVDPLDVPRLEKNPNIILTDKGQEGFAGVETILLNLNNKPLSDVRVRRALSHAIDKDYIVEKVKFGKAKVATGPISYKLKWAYNPNVTTYKHDAELAKKLLDEAGYKADAEGVRFHLKAIYAQGYAKIFEVLRDQFKEVGVILDMNQVEFSSMVDQVYIKKDFDVSVSSFENGPDPDIGVKRTLISSNIGAIPFSNGSGYKNARVDELFELAAAEKDRQKRAEYYYEIQEITAKDVPYFRLYSGTSESAYRKELQGMFEWSAKSGTYFAQDAWWLNGERPDNSASEVLGNRQFYFFAGLAILGLIAVILILIRRKLKRI